MPSILLGPARVRQMGRRAQVASPVRNPSASGGGRWARAHAPGRRTSWDQQTHRRRP